jgi:hypothetical protein
MALQPLTSQLFEAALADLHAKSAAKLSHTARIGPVSRRAQQVPAAKASDGAALALALLREVQINPKLLDPHGTSTAAVGAASAAAALVPVHSLSNPDGVSPASPTSSPAIVPPLNLSLLATEASRPVSFVHHSIPATALTARHEWMRRGGQASPARRPLAPVKGATAPVLESDAVLEVELLLRQKQQRMQELLTDSVASQYRSLKCPSPDLGFRIVFNGSSSFNIFRPFDTVRVVSARSSRTILNRAVAPLSERQMPPRRPHHGQYLTYRQDFFDDEGSRAATRSSRRHPSSARSVNTIAAHKLQAKLDALEGDALRALNMTFNPRLPAVASRTSAATSRSPVTEVSQGSTIHPSPPPPKKAAAAQSPASARVLRAGLAKTDRSKAIHGSSDAGTTWEGSKAP